MASLQVRPAAATLRRRMSWVPVSSTRSSKLARTMTMQSLSTPLRASQWHTTTTTSSSSSSNSFLPIQQTRTFLAKLTRKSPAASASSSRNSSSDAQSQTQSQNQTQTPPPLQLTNLPYFVRRTPSNQLPVYLVTKAGGTKRQTKIQKAEGDLEALRSDLARALGVETGAPGEKKSPDVSINRLTGHIIVKGWRKPEIQKFLLERNF